MFRNFFKFPIIFVHHFIIFFTFLMKPKYIVKKRSSPIETFIVNPKVVFYSRIMAYKKNYNWKKKQFFVRCCCLACCQLIIFFSLKMMLLLHCLIVLLSWLLLLYNRICAKCWHFYVGTLESHRWWPIIRDSLAFCQMTSFPFSIFITWKCFA